MLSRFFKFLRSFVLLVSFLFGALASAESTRLCGVVEPICEEDLPACYSAVLVRKNRNSEPEVIRLTSSDEDIRSILKRGFEPRYSGPACVWGEMISIDPHEVFDVEEIRFSTGRSGMSIGNK